MIKLNLLNSGGSGGVRFPSDFRCHEGYEDNFVETTCDRQCQYGVDCMCIKVDYVPGQFSFYNNMGTSKPSKPHGSMIRMLAFAGKGTVRGCWANPHSALTPGCFTSNFQGSILPMCLCDTPMCNRSPEKSVGPLWVTLTTCLALTVCRLAL